MHKFAFRLEPALRWRTRRREEEEANLRKLLERRDALKRQTEAMQRERSETMRFVSEGAPAEARDLRALAGYTLGWQARNVNLCAITRQNDALISEQWGRMIAAQQQEKMLINLREKHFQKWRREIEKTIQTEAEEAWLALWGKRDKIFPS